MAVSSVSKGQDIPHDLLIVVDATGSTSFYLHSLRAALPQILSLSALTGCFRKIGIIAYRDYDASDISRTELIEWSGWYNEADEFSSSYPDLIKFAKNLTAGGNGDTPEAVKTGLSKAFEVMSGPTLMLLFADAPPHSPANKDGSFSTNHRVEQQILSDKALYGGHSSKFLDWVSACKTLAGGRAQVFCIIDRNLEAWNTGFFVFLAKVTGGLCFGVDDRDAHNISLMTVSLILKWIGVESQDAEALSPIYLNGYWKEQSLHLVENEVDSPAGEYFDTPSLSHADSINVKTTQVSNKVLAKKIHKSQGIFNFVERYPLNDDYRRLVAKHLKVTIDTDVTALALNPVLGDLWRAVCKDRTSEHKQALVASFGLAIDRISSLEDKGRMKQWLEESYDSTGEVLQIIHSVPAEQKYPFVCLDSTVKFAKTGSDDGDDESEITNLKRSELFEIARSCHYKILQRLGRVLTRLTYVQSESDMPEHLARTTNEEVSKITMALATEEHGFQFWKILLHFVVPGTMLSPRPSALLAALSLRMGIVPLKASAEIEVLKWNEAWNDPTLFPETWAMECLSLMVDADKAYINDHPEEDHGLLKPGDRSVYDKLIAYKLLELNLETPLEAFIGWTPTKTKTLLGACIICKQCQYPRSVTIMGKDSVCGLCLFPDYDNKEAQDDAIHCNVSKDMDAASPISWVECSVRDCRSQYVVYQVSHLNVSPKCWYRRSNGKLLPDGPTHVAPYPECIACRNRVIYPPEYRPHSLDPASWTCFFCPTQPVRTIVPTSTTPSVLSNENGTSWLIGSDAIKIGFTGRSLHHLVKTHGLGPPNGVSCISILPSSSTPPSLTLNSKPIQNINSLLIHLSTHIDTHTVSTSTCSLCFTTQHASKLLPSCGRRGCHQRVDAACLRAWYGINAPGRPLNISALRCPFCRRDPAGRWLAKWGTGVHQLGGLKDALTGEGRGEIWGWCRRCDFAKHIGERVCGRTAEDEMDGEFTCADCREELVTKESGERGGHVMGAKECPKCGVMTEKTRGCNHIECSVEGCGAHWCYVCGEDVGYEGIYRHMSLEHGGFFDGEDDGEGGVWEEDD